MGILTDSVNRKFAYRERLMARRDDFAPREVLPEMSGYHGDDWTGDEYLQTSERAQAGVLEDIVRQYEDDPEVLRWRDAHSAEDDDDRWQAALTQSPAEEIPTQIKDAKSRLDEMRVRAGRLGLGNQLLYGNAFARGDRPCCRVGGGGNYGDTPFGAGCQDWFWGGWGGESNAGGGSRRRGVAGGGGGDAN